MSSAAKSSDVPAASLLNSKQISSQPDARFEWLLIFVIFFVIGGAPAPHVNEAHYLTKAKHYWDPSYCPGDFFLDSADPHLTFYWTVGVLTQWLSLPATAWVGRVAAWALLATGWQRLARSVDSSPWIAPLSAALWVVLIEKCNFAGEWIVGGVEAKCFAYGFVLLGLAALARSRWTIVWIWLGLASAMHVLVGAWAVLGAFAVWITEPRTSRPAFHSLLPGLLLGGVVSLPGLLPALALERGVDPNVSAEAARIYVFDRLPHHLAPLTLTTPELLPKLRQFGLLTVAFVALWVWASRRSSHTSADRPPGDHPSAAPTPLDRMLRFAWFSLATSVVGLIIEVALQGSPLIAARVLRYYWFRQADVAVPLAAALAGTVFMFRMIRSGSRWRAAASTTPALWCGGVLLATAMGRWLDPVPPAAARIENLPAWQDACHWIDANTPPDALFFIPRSAHSFKWYASRADVANRKDVPQDAASVVEWRRRCDELFPTVDWFGSVKTLDSVALQGADKIRELAEAYGATHVIASADQPLDLPVAYTSAVNLDEVQYVVYETGVAPQDGAP